MTKNLAKGKRRSKNSCNQISRKEKLKEMIKSPISSLLNSVHLEMNGNKEVIIEGCKSILEYDENLVKISVKNMTISFFGRNLLIKCLTSDSLVIDGFITSIEFATWGG